AVDLYLSGDLFARFRVAQPLEERFVTAILRPRRQTSIESRASGDVSVHIGTNGQTFLARRFDAGEKGIDLTPIFLTKSLDVIKLYRNVCLTRNAKELIKCFQQPIPFAAHMRDVFAFVFRGDFAKLDQLFSLGVKGWWINQRGADAERAGFHFLSHQLAHLIELFRRRLFVVKADNVLAYRGRAYERGDVAGHAALFEIPAI